MYFLKFLLYLKNIFSRNFSVIYIIFNNINKEINIKLLNIKYLIINIKLLHE